MGRVSKMFRALFGVSLDFSSTSTREVAATEIVNFFLFVATQR